MTWAIGIDTTGLFGKNTPHDWKPEVCAICVVRLDDLNAFRQWTVRTVHDPAHPNAATAMRVNGHSFDDIRASLSSGDVALQLNQHTYGKALIAWDMPFLRSFFLGTGFEPLLPYFTIADGKELFTARLGVKAPALHKAALRFDVTGAWEPVSRLNARTSMVAGIAAALGIK